MCVCGVLRPTQPPTLCGTRNELYCSLPNVDYGMKAYRYRADWAVAYLLAAPQIELWVIPGSGWLRNALRYYQLVTTFEIVKHYTVLTPCKQQCCSRRPDLCLLLFRAAWTIWSSVHVQRQLSCVVENSELAVDSSVDCSGGYSGQLLTRRHGNADAFSIHQRIIACGFHPYRR